jgi:hypothetical protein
MDEEKLDDKQRLFLTQKLHRYRMQLGFKAWALQEYRRRNDPYGLHTPYAELRRDYEAVIEMRWPAYRHYAEHHFSDAELVSYHEAYGLVDHEQLWYATSNEQTDPSMPDYPDAVEKYRLLDLPAAPANENRAGARLRGPAGLEASPAGEAGPGIPPAAPDPAHRGQFQRPDDAKGRDR